MCLPPQFPERVRAYLLKLCDQYVERGLQFIQRRCVQAMGQVDISKVTSLCCLLEALLLGSGGPDLGMVHTHTHTHTVEGRMYAVR